MKIFSLGSIDFPVSRPSGQTDIPPLFRTDLANLATRPGRERERPAKMVGDQVALFTPENSRRLCRKLIFFGFLLVVSTLYVMNSLPLFWQPPLRSVFFFFFLVTTTHSPPNTPPRLGARIHGTLVLEGERRKKKKLIYISDRTIPAPSYNLQIDRQTGFFFFFWVR